MSVAGTTRGARALEAIGLLALFVLYFRTLSPELTNGDAGEIATAVARLGVMHPTGYPLFTLLGHAFLKLPLPFEPFYALEILNAILAVGAVVCIVRCVETLASGPLRRTSSTQSGVPESDTRGPVSWATSCGLVAGLLFGVSPALWEQVVVVELYALHVLLLSASIWALARFEVERRDRDLLWAIALMALGCAHHVTMVYLGGPTLLYVALRRPRALFSRVAVAGAALLALALLLYAYLPWAGATTTAIPWDVRDFAGVWRHVTGAQYASFMEGWSEATARRAETLFPWLRLQAPLPVLAVSALGLGALAHRAWPFLGLLLLFAALNVLHGIQYAVGDFSVYFLPVLVVVFVGVGCGLVWSTQTRVAQPALSRTIVALALGLVVVQAWRHVEPVSKAHVSAESYLASVVREVPPGSVYLTARDPFVLPLWYAQHVRGDARDVAVVNVLMLSLPWYRSDYLERHHDWLKLDSAPRRGPVREGPPPERRPIADGADPACRDPAVRRARPRLCACWDTNETAREWDHLCRLTWERRGVARHFGPEIDAQRIVEDHVGERRVFERNVFSYWWEGKTGRRWEGPAFHRISGEYALVNRGEVNEILPFASIDGVDPCSSETLHALEQPPLGPPREGPTPPTERRPYVPNERPLLLSHSTLHTPDGGSGGDALEPQRDLELRLWWFERFYPDRRRVDTAGRRVRHGIRVCWFGPDGRRLKLDSLVTDGEHGSVHLPGASLATPGTYTIQACTVGDVGADATVPAEAPCRYPILERSFEVSEAPPP